MFFYVIAMLIIAFLLVIWTYFLRIMNSWEWRLIFSYYVSAICLILVVIFLALVLS